jgi:hypothetical protein
LKIEDPNFVPGLGITNLPAPPKGEKRPREGDGTDDKPAKKERRAQEPVDEEMEIEDDE